MGAEARQWEEEGAGGSSQGTRACSDGMGAGAAVDGRLDGRDSTDPCIRGGM